MSADLLDSAFREIARLLAPLVRAAENPRAFVRLLSELGVKPDALGSDSDRLLATLAAVAGVQDRLEALIARPSPSLQTFADALALCDEALTAVRGLDSPGALSDTFAGLGEDLSAWLIARYLDQWHPRAYRLAVLATLIEPSYEREVHLPDIRDDAVVRDAINFDQFRLDRLIALIRDPVAALRAQYGTVFGSTEEAQKIQTKLFPRLQQVLRILGVPCRYGFDLDDSPSLGDAAPLLNHALIFYLDDVLAGATAEAGVILNVSLADRGDLGLVVSPFGSLSTQRQVGAWQLEVSVTGDVQTIAYGRHGLTLPPEASTTQVEASLSVTLPVPEDRPAFVFGAPNGTRLEVAGTLLSLAATLSESQQSLALSADVLAAALVISPTNTDGFLASLLPPEGLRADVTIGLAWSSDKGLTLRGSAGLDATLPVGLSIGPVTLSTVHLSLQAREAAVSTVASASFAASIGPIHIAVDHVGMTAAITFPETGGNLGVANLNLGFKPPDGLGLAIQAPAVTGGGFLAFDSDKQEYAGVLQLEIAETVSVKAVGLLTTRMPDGSSGYSLVIVVASEGFAPIQLGFGFTLTGIGGLLSIHRTVAVDVLRGGIKNGTLGSVLFPADPIRNAPQIVSDLRAVFPPTRNRHVFGPMAQIEWGTPTLFTLQLALILELPEPVRLIILGRLLADLPDAAHSLVRLRMDAVGLIDFNRNEIALDATLYDSSIMEFALSGDMALRANWGARPDFVLAVGGFNPGYPVPAGFPRLQRLTLSLGDGDNPRLRFESYLALTSNTVQFGGRLDFAYTASGFTLAGFLGMDALFQFEPFAFVTDIGAMVALKRGRSTLMSVSLEMSLAGPTPWHVWGKAKFKILFFTVKIGFDQRFGHDQPPPLPEPVDALALLVQALNDRRNWSGALPRSEPAVVTLREAAAGRLHPLARLSVRQRVVPLNRTITRFGNAPLAGGAGTFTVTATGGPAATYLQEAFAPAQYQDYSDDDKLAQPAFVDYDAGLGFADDAVAYQYEALPDLDIVYETQFIDPTRPPDTPPPPAYTLPAAALTQVVDYAAAAQAPIRHRGANRYRRFEQAA